VAWAAYRAAPEVGDGFRPITIDLLPQHYPYWSRSAEDEPRGVISAVLVARGTGQLQVAGPDGSDPQDLGTFTGDLVRAELTDPPPFTGRWSAALTADTVADAWLLVRWGRDDT
jgi:hypothetical protein